MSSPPFSRGEWEGFEVSLLVGFERILGLCMLFGGSRFSPELLPTKFKEQLIIAFQIDPMVRKLF